MSSAPAICAAVVTLPVNAKLMASPCSSPNALRRLSLIYRREGAAYSDLEASAKAYLGKVDAGESTETIKRMWRELAASLHERTIQMLDDTPPSSGSKCVG